MIVTLTPNPSVDRTLVLDTFTRGAVTERARDAVTTSSSCRVINGSD